MGSRHNPGKGLPSSQGKLECTNDCRWVEHASMALSATFLGNIKLLQHCATVCGNPFRIQDEFGRNALHVAASCGHLELVYWLLARKKVKVNLQDWESKWTPLHRSMFYGQVGASALLMKYGGNLNMVDDEGWTPLMILNYNGEIVKDKLIVDSVMVHTWGRNPNTTLGHERSKEHPERLDLSLLRGTHIVQIVLCKFHTVMLTSGGSVLTCGHGLGGRLGHNSEQSVVDPRRVEAVGDYICVGVAAARNHTVILTKGGAVFTCGINDAHQLGLGHSAASAPSNCLAPKQVKLLKSKHVIAVGAGRFHTAMCTEAELYTVGQNLGQLGYKKVTETQVAPRVVPGINLEDGDSIRCMSASDSATAVLSKMHHVFVCTDFIVRHIRFGFLEKVSCKQFEVCASLSDKDYLRQVETEPTKVLLLDSEHKLWIWQPMKKGAPSILSGFAKHSVVQFSLGRNLTVVTKEGEVLKSSASISRGPVCLQRVPHIQNARAVFTDFKANNFAYLQNIYRSPFLPIISPSTLATDLSSLLEEVCLPGSTSDVELEDTNVPSSYKLGDRCNSPAVFDAFLHYIYGSHIRLLPLYSQGTEDSTKPKVSDDSEGGGDVEVSVGLPMPPASTEQSEFTPDTSLASLDDNDLTEEYDNYASNDPPVDNLGPAIPIHSTPKKNRCFPRVTNRLADSQGTGNMKVLHLHHRQLELRALLKLASSFGLTDLQKRLEVLLSSQVVMGKPFTIPRPLLDLKRQGEFSDLTLVSEEEKSIQCHKCVLVARSEYFRSMLLMGWKESLEGPAILSLPVKFKVLKAVIDFIYTDEFRVPTVTGYEVIDWVMLVLIIADQLLLTRLKELCELSLAKSLNLRNTVEFLEFSEVYSAHQLKKSCFQFICVNPSCFLEGRYLDNISLSLLEQLTHTYRELIPSLTKRIIKFPEPKVETLPESYFRDSGLGEEVLLSGQSDNEEDSTVFGTDAIADSSHQSASSVRDVVSPRTASNSRRKRKRKNSHTEARARQNSLSRASQVSPTEKEPSEAATPENSSKIERTSPAEEVFLSSPSALPYIVQNTLMATPKSTSEPLSTPKSSSRSKPKHNSTPNSKAGGVSSSHLDKLDSCNQRVSGTKGTTQAFGTSPISSIVSPDIYNGSKANRTQPVTVHQTELRAPNIVTKTPSSAPVGKTGGKAKKRSGSARIRLSMKFDDVSDGSRMGWNETEASSVARAEPSSPASATMPKGAWSFSSVPQEAKCLRDIIANEEEIATKLQRQRSPSFGTISSSGSENGTGQVPKSTSRKLATSEPIPVGSNKSKQKDGSLSPCVSPSPSNPWKKSGSSPTVSMRDLMAEAEAEEKQSRQRATVSKNKVIMRSLDTKSCYQVTGNIPHQPVSFASIIKSQEKNEKKNKMTARKALPLIQIEERAISELKQSYSSCGNPDEYILVERFQNTKSSNPVISPWVTNGR